MISEQDQSFLHRAMRLAMNGRGHVEPNPMVGCVLVKNGQVVGEGWHQKYGQPHAEPNALADCRHRGNDPAGATAYVTLEPCCHTNKQTPPCAPRLIEAKIARVVIGCLDPNPDVNGKGVAMLRAAGIEVDALPDRDVGSQPKETASRVENPCHELDASHFKQLIAPFIARIASNARYFTAKWAQTADGRVSGPHRARLAISNAKSNEIVQRLRAGCDAIVIGIGTALADDPLLTVRGPRGSRVLRRYVFDSELRLPLDSQLVRTARDVPLTVITDGTRTDDRRFIARADALRSAGVTIDADVPRRGDGLDLFEALRMGSLQAGDKMHVLFEPGPTLARSILPMMDRIWVIRSSTVTSPHGLPAPAVPDAFVTTGSIDLGGDTLSEYLNTRSAAFFAATPSADFVLAAESAAQAPRT